MPCLAARAVLSFPIYIICFVPMVYLLIPPHAVTTIYRDVLYHPMPVLCRPYSATSSYQYVVPCCFTKVYFTIAVMYMYHIIPYTIPYHNVPLPVLYGAIPCFIIPCHNVPYDLVLPQSVPYHAMPSQAILCHTGVLIFIRTSYMYV